METENESVNVIADGDVASFPEKRSVPGSEHK